MGVNPSSTSVLDGVCFGVYGRPIRNTRPSSSESHREWNMATEVEPHDLMVQRPSILGAGLGAARERKMAPNFS